ncbi:hypothetical protein GCM10009839_15320 [Catenulispora yoronensis]|uniref:DUF418 domain-containing protein n=1 Tax=Catenulispora yoronensis TaxID=450799 RepID=A0ABN2TTJ0_9ACTN
MFAPLFALCVAAVAVRDVEGGKSWLRSPVLVALGRWSFSFYLVESTVLNACAQSLGGRRPEAWLGNVPWLLLALVVAVALSAFLHRWVEQPMERYLKGLWPDRRVPFRPAFHRTP